MIDPSASPDEHALAVLAARTADDKKASDVMVLAVAEVLPIADYFVICSAPNRRLVRTIAEAIEDVVKVELGRAPVRVEGIREQQWVLVDYGDVVVHVFLDEIRDFYEIERLYRDAPQLAWADDVAGHGPAAAANVGD